MNTTNNAAFDESRAYIYASFSKNDRDAVLPILDAMKGEGCRVWYDTETPDETAWPDETARRLSASAVVLSFVTQNAVGDPTCIRDVNFALMCKKTIVTVHMEPVNLPIGMQMQLSAAKSVYRYMARDEHEFFDNLYHIQEIDQCKDPVPAAVPQEAPPAESNPFGIGGVRGGLDLEGTKQYVPNASLPKQPPADEEAPAHEEAAPPASPSHCPNCGAEAPAGYKFCIKCGAPLSEQAPAQQPPEESAPDAPAQEDHNERQEQEMGYGQNGYENNQGQVPYGNDPYAQQNAPYGQPPYGQQPYADPYANAPYGNQGNDPYAQQPYAAPYGNQGADPYAQQPYADPYANAPYGNQGADPYAQQPYADPYANPGADPYAQQPYADPYANQGADPYAQQPYADPYANQGNDPYANQPYANQAQNPYGNAPAYGQDPYGAAPYGDPYGNQNYGRNSYGAGAQGGFMLRRIKTGEEVPVPTGDFVLGRSETLADYVITGNKTIGRKHAMITVQDDGCSIVDLESLNKTRINDIELLPNVSYELNEGDVIGLSNEQFLFHRR